MARTKTVKARTRRTFGRLRKLPSGRWQASYLHNGVVHGAPATFPTEKSGDYWLQSEQDLIDLDRRQPGTWAPPADRVAKAAATKLTFRGYAERWLEYRPLRRRTRDLYRYHLDRNLYPVLGDAVLADITPEDVRVWFAGLGTVNETRNAQAYGLLTAVLNTAVDDGLLAQSPARIKGASTVKGRRRAVILEPDELAALADKMPAPLALTVLLAGWCGLRRGEVFALTRGDFTADGSTVAITKAVTYRERRYVCGPTKTAESNRIVPVPPHLRPIIVRHLHEHVGETKGALLFADPDTGSFYPEWRFRVPFFAARSAIGHDTVRFHDLRHFGGTMAALTGATLREIQDRLGHTTVEAAMRYQAMAAGRADLMAERLSALAAAPRGTETR